MNLEEWSLNNRRGKANNRSSDFGCRILLFIDFTFYRRSPFITLLIKETKHVKMRWYIRQDKLTNTSK